MIDVGKQLQDAYDEGYKHRDADIVRCKDCKFYGEMLQKKDTRMICHKICLNTKPDDFCSLAERRSE